jgi:MFS family permease
MLAEQGWRVVYLAIAAAVLVVLVPGALLLRRRVPEGANLRSDAAAQARGHVTRFSPRQLQGLLALAGIGCCVAMSMPQVHIVVYAADLGYGAAAGGKMLSLMLMGGVVSRLASGLVADRLGGVRTLLISSAMQTTALFLFLPFDGLVGLYVVSLVFGLSQGGIVPSYALIVREYLPAREAGARVGFVLMATIFGMALGGWMSGWIHDLTGSYRLAVLNGIGWNVMNIGIMLLVLFSARRVSGDKVAAE